MPMRIDAAEDTALEATLAARGVSHVVLAGAESAWCIRATAYGALERGYDLTLIDDAHTTEIDDALSVQGLGSGQHWIELVLTPEQRRIFEQLQALMSLVEGYGNHVMNAVGRRLLPSFEQIEQRVAQRQSTKTLLEQIFNRITGMDITFVTTARTNEEAKALLTEFGFPFRN